MCTDCKILGKVGEGRLRLSASMQQTSSNCTYASVSRKTFMTDEGYLKT